ncbi:hypothetical protein [Paludifilum halophilum]|uniref:Uncharacterized protein n=1 Tax=Paludifilum halophilum TaxID=1642702 RepID=A0A235B7Q4_9BACL|nr:hypothetical protein [Paludifilum halophilum]OYD08343.1 hypothetical protein CHM34_05720 [Paludifilum halophilum]
MLPRSVHKRPRLPLFTPFTMGMIQPEWLYMNHDFDEEEPEEEAPEKQDPSDSEKGSLQSPPRVNIRPRPEGPPVEH